MDERTPDFRDRYRVVGKAEAKAKGYPDSYDVTEWGWGLYEFDPHGKVVALVGSDGGEPEDQCLVRDWDWVAPALADARAAGFREGLIAAERREEGPGDGTDRTDKTDAHTT